MKLGVSTWGKGWILVYFFEFLLFLLLWVVVEKYYRTFDFFFICHYAPKDQKCNCSVVFNHK